MGAPNDTPGWLERPKTVNRLVHGLWIACGLALLADFVYIHHPHFGWDGWYDFHAVFGFLAYVLIVLSAKGLRRLVRRDEDYYGDGEGLAPPPGDGKSHE